MEITTKKKIENSVKIKAGDSIIPVSFDSVVFVYDKESEKYYAFIKLTGSAKEIALSSYGVLNTN